MGTRRVPILVIAIVIAAMTALATFKYVSKADERALGDAQPVVVGPSSVAAKRDPSRVLPVMESFRL